MMIKDILIRRHINRDLPVPFYYQIVEILREIIRDMEVEPGETEILPSEPELCEIFQVNRGTLRHALEMLAHEGLIYREKGRGTFIRRKRYELDLLNFSSTTDELQARGHVPSTRLLQISAIQPTLHIQKSLWLTESDLVWQLYRLRLADGEPISLQLSHVPVALATDIDRQPLEGSLYQILKNEYHIQLTSADQIIRARLVTQEEAELLAIEPGDPVIEVARISYDQNEEPVEYMDSLWRADRYDLRVHLSKDGL